MEMSRWKRFRLFFSAAELLNRRQIGSLFWHPCAISNPNDVAFFHFEDILKNVLQYVQKKLLMAAIKLQKGQRA